MPAEDAKIWYQRLLSRDDWLCIEASRESVFNRAEGGSYHIHASFLDPFLVPDKIPGYNIYVIIITWTLLLPTLPLPLLTIPLPPPHPLAAS